MKNQNLGYFKGLHDTYISLLIDHEGDLEIAIAQPGKPERYFFLAPQDAIELAHAIIEGYHES